MKRRIILAGLSTTVALLGQPAEQLPELAVYSPRIANQSPVATFAMPVSALRFEPRVDIQARNFAEGQADVTIRGGIFENTGFRLGALSLFDPQTGHYFAEIPVAPAMLGAPEIQTGAELSSGALNATVGVVAYGWRPIRTAGFATLSGGQFGLTQGEAYQGYVSDAKLGGRTLAADAAWAHSDADGSVPNGDHVLNRVNARVQLRSATEQTDLFAGYQAKFFGWPNLYTPFNSPESEDLETVLLAANHRVDLGAGDFVEIGAYHRRNKDDYAFNRFAAVGPVRPFNHTTWVTDAAASGRRTVGELAINFRAEALADEIRSTSLLYGRYHTRSLTKLSLIPERAWPLASGDEVVIKAGATYDDSNRASSAVSPVVEIARQHRGAPARIYASYAEATQLPTYTALNSSPSAGLFRGNPNLGRETSRNFEVGATQSFDGWLVTGAVFYRRDDDLVDWTFKRGVTARAANAVDIATTGAELVARRSWTRLDFVVGYTWLSKDADYKGAAVDASFYALNYARQRLTAAITWRVTSRVDVHMDNSVRDQAANLLRTRGGHQPILSALGVTWRPVWLPRVSLTAQVANLWDSEYQEVPAVPAARRQWSASASYAW